MPPHLYAPHTNMCPHTFVHPQGCTYPHMPPYSSMPLCVFGGFVCCGGCNGLPFVLGHPPLHHPYFGMPPLYYTATLSHWFPVHWYVSGISVCYVGISLLSGRVWECSPHWLGVWWASALEMSICSFLYIFVVHYVSHFDYGSNYYFFSYCGIFWLVFHVISDSGAFPDRVSSKLGSAWHGSPTTLDAKRLWRCFWLSFCDTVANSIFNASFSLCQLCYGFSTGRFHFQS